MTSDENIGQKCRRTTPDVSVAYYMIKGHEVSRGIKWAYEGVYLANPTLQEEFGPCQDLGGIRAHKEFQKIINIIKAIDSDHPHDFGN